MKKNILSVIFFLLCFLSFFIFKKFNKNNLDILYIGDNNVYNTLISSFELNVNKYTYDSVTYKDIENNIKSNDFKIIKNKNVYLNQLISKSDILIMSANNFKYKNKCKKNERILNEYDEIVYSEIISLYDVIEKISDAKVYIVGNECFKSNHKQLFEFDNIYYISSSNIENIEDFIVKTANN